MDKNRQSSFSRILLLRILLLIVPVLLIGEFVTYKKARSSLLETARQNLTESAIIKGEKIGDTIESLKSNLSTAVEARVFQSGSAIEIQQFLHQLAGKSPKYIDCIQLRDTQDSSIIASTCGSQPIGDLKLNFSNQGISIDPIVPRKTVTSAIGEGTNQLKLLLSAPVLDGAGKLRYILSLQSAALQQPTKQVSGVFVGATIVIAEDGTILAHPIAESVGTNIASHPDALKLKKIVKNAIAGEEKASNLYFEDDTEYIAGYTAIPNPISVEQQKLVILAVSSVERSLYGLWDIKLILVILTMGLIGTSLLASLYLARYLAHPMETLRDYALNLQTHHNTSVPQDFRVRELNQLAQALNRMVWRLKNSALESEKAWKEAHLANQMKNQFLAVTSHELRNPLHTIINCLKLVVDDLCEDRGEELEFLQKADEAALHLLGIVNDLLDISKIEAGQVSLVLEFLDLRKLLQEVVNLQSVNIKQKGLLFIVDIDKSSFPVKIDKAKFKQVLINVIGNATKFTETGSITLTAKIKKRDGQSLVLITVKDTGIGIDPDNQDKLFKPFSTADEKTSRKFGGTGLGLAISRNLIEMMGGSINIDSHGIDKGSVVTICLPIVEFYKDAGDSQFTVKNVSQPKTGNSINETTSVLNKTLS
jgi:two-component system, NarL family, sensor histidine kinase BarA